MQDVNTVVLAQITNVGGFTGSGPITTSQTLAGAGTGIDASKLQGAAPTNGLFTVPHQALPADVAYLDAAQNWTTTQTHKPTTAADIGLIVQGLGSQSGDLQQWQNNTPTPLLSVDKAGRIISAAGTPTLTNINAHIATSRITGTDQRGYVQLTADGTGVAAGSKLCTVTFATAYLSTPFPVLTLVLAGTNLYGGTGTVGFSTRVDVGNPTTTSFDIYCPNTFTAGQTMGLIYDLLG